MWVRWFLICCFLCVGTLGGAQLPNTQEAIHNTYQHHDIKENYKTHLEHFNHSSEIDLDDITYDEYDVVVIYTSSNKFMVISKNIILTQGTCKGDHYMLLIGISILRGIGLFTNLKDQ